MKDEIVSETHGIYPSPSLQGLKKVTYQSYLDLKLSVQNVHWKSRFPSSGLAFGARVGSRRRLRLSFAFKLFIEPRECREPYE